MVKGVLEFLTLGVLVFTGRPTHASSPLELNPPRAVVRYGDSVSVNCSTSITDLEGMGWEATLGGISFKPDVNIVTWTVDNLTDWTIKPKCYKALTNGEQKLRVLPVILYKTPDSVSISPLSYSGPMVEGTKYQLQCDIQNVAPLQNLVVKWYKGDEPLDNVIYSNVSKTPEDVSATLMITPSRDDDGAQYRCVAELDLGPDGPQPHPTVTSEPLKITVHYAPKFTCPKRYEIKENENHNLPVYCTVDGNPSPKITWLKAGKEVDIPQSLTRENSGEYTVVTNNKHGQVSHMLVIDVLYAPEFLLGNDTVKVSGGSDVSLNCSAEGNPPPQMKWNYTTADNVMLSTVERLRTVSITRATSTNAGIYICTATNIVGTATRTITVTMKDYPVLIILVIILVVILLSVLFLIAFCMLRKRKGH